MNTGPMEPVFTTEPGRLFQGDCIELMSQMEPGSVDLIFADPPFNLGKLYGDHYDDTKQ